MSKRQCPGRASFYSLIFSSFHSVAKLPYVQNKWIEMKVWIELMKLHNFPQLDIIQNITKDKFKRAMLNTDSAMLSTNFKEINSHGYYYGRSKIKISRKSQYADAVFVTEPGQDCHSSLRLLIGNIMSSSIYPHLGAHIPIHQNL